MNTPADSVRRASALLGTPDDPSGYVILKLMPHEGGCCCLHCWPETWRAVNRHIAPAGPVEHEGDVLLGDKEWRFVLEGHEHGPEIIAYLAVLTASVLGVKAVVELVTTILKGVSEDRKKVSRMRLVKRFASRNNFAEEVLLEIDLPLSEEAAKKLESQIRESLTERRASRRIVRREARNSRTPALKRKRNQ